MKSPLAHTVQFTPVDPKFRNVTLIRWGSTVAISVIVLIVVAILGGRFTDSRWLWVALVVLAMGIGAWVVWLAVRRARAFGYAELESELLIRSGIMFHRVSVVPYGRMQQVNIETGPLLNRYGLATVELVTAAVGTDARIPGVARAEAERLREKLTALGEANMEGL